MPRISEYQPVPEDDPIPEGWLGPCVWCHRYLHTIIGDRGRMKGNDVAQINCPCGGYAVVKPSFNPLTDRAGEPRLDDDPEGFI